MVIPIRQLTNSAVVSGTNYGAAAAYIVKRGTTPQVGVQYFDENNSVILTPFPPGTVITLGAKAPNPANAIAPGTTAFDGPYVVAGAWAGGPDVNGIYWIPMGFSNDTLSGLLGFNPPTANDDVVSVTLAAEVMTVTPGGDVEKSQTFSFVIQHDINTAGPNVTYTPPPSLAQTYIYGAQAIAAAVDFVTVAGLAQAAAPGLIIAQVVKTGGGAGNIDCVLRAGWTSNTFTVDLTGVTPDATYVLTYLLIPASVAVGSVPVGAGIDTLAVNLTLPGAPTLIIPTLVKAGGGEVNIRAFLRGGWTGAGFIVDFNANTPDATYVLYYLIIP